MVCRGVAAEQVVVRQGKVLLQKAGGPVPLDQDLQLSAELKVSTNGTFFVCGGPARPLREGQALSADGLLTSPDGSAAPVFDHVAMRQGKPCLVKDGVISALTTELRLGDGSRVTPEGVRVARDGRRSRMLDGQWFRLDGQALPAKDTVLLKDGAVIVQKDGSTLTLRPAQSLMMNDGTKVFGNGSLVFSDGRKKVLVEGERLTLDGVGGAGKPPPPQ
jgi:hypothetical protein